MEEDSMYLNVVTMNRETQISRFLSGPVVRPKPIHHQSPEPSPILVVPSQLSHSYIPCWDLL